MNGGFGGRFLQNGVGRLAFDPLGARRRKKVLLAQHVFLEVRERGGTFLGRWLYGELEDRLFDGILSGVSLVRKVHLLEEVINSNYLSAHACSVLFLLTVAHN